MRWAMQNSSPQPPSQRTVAMAGNPPGPIRLCPFLTAIALTFLWAALNLYTPPPTLACTLPIRSRFAASLHWRLRPPADRLRKTAIARQCHVNGKLPRWGASAAKRQVVRRRRPYCSLGHSAQTRFVPRSALSCIALQWRPWTWKIPSSIAPRFIPRLAALYDARFSVLKAMI